MASLRRRLGALILLFLFTLALPSDPVSASEAFTARGVDVDVSAATVAAAKEQALAEAERVGLRRVLERLTAAEDHGRLPAVDARQYVRDVAVEQERSSAVRYIATMTVRYNPAAVKKLLRDSGLRFAEPRPRPVVVAPLVVGSGGTAPVWDEAGPWRAAWTSQGGGGLVPLVVASAQSAQAPADRLAAGDPVVLTQLGTSHRGGDALTAVATVTAATVEVRLIGGPTLAVPFDSRVFPVGEGGVDAALRAAAAEIVHGLELQYRQQNLLSFDRPATLTAVAPLRGLEDWLAIRERLGRVPQVRRFELVSLTRDEAGLSLHVLGDPEQVRTALATAGLALESSDGGWTLRLGGGR